MRGPDGRGASGAAAPPTAYRAFTDQQLILALRRNDLRALDEFIRRFRPLLLRRAHQWGSPRGEREDLVVELLEDTAAQLCAWDTRIPRSLGAWLSGALRHRLVNARRQRGRHERRDQDAADEGDESDERVVPSVVSEAALRASRGPDGDLAVFSRPIARLEEALDQGLTDAEREILVWVAHGVPKRTIAEWTGARYEAVKKRISRLQARLRGAAAAYASRLDGDERREVMRFIRRASAPAVPAPVPPSVRLGPPLGATHADPGDEEECER